VRRAVLRLRAILISGLISMTPLISATAASMEDAIIVYGGVGNLGRDAQPCLAMLYEGGKKFLPYTDKINNSIRKALSGITLFPEKKSVIVGADQLNAAIKKNGIEFERRPSQTQIKEFLEDNEGNILALSIVGGAEVYVPFTHDLGKRRSDTKIGKTYVEDFSVSIAAIITQISGDNAGQVLASAVFVGQGQSSTNTKAFLGHGETGCDNPDTASDIWLEYISNTYAGAAKNVIGTLVKQQKTADEDTTSIIVMGVTVDSKVVKDLFRIVDTDPKSVKSICEIPLPCSDGDKRCMGLIGSMAFALTDTMSRRGFLAIPPLNWGAWGKSGQYQVAKNLKMTGGRSDILPFVQMNVGPNAADRKLHSTVTKFVEKGLPDKKNKYVGYRHYLGFMKHRWEETDIDDCKVIEDRGDYPETKFHLRFKRPLKLIGTDLPIGRRQSFVVATLLKTIWALEKKIELD
jgi:hypothetical protein